MMSRETRQEIFWAVVLGLFIGGLYALVWFSV